jgi:hypothetical protein
LEPPVTDSQVSAAWATISPMARVSIRKNTPAVRTATQPLAAAAAPPAARAISSGRGPVAETFLVNQAAA